MVGMDRQDCMEVGDQELLAEYVRGDTNALAELVGRYRRMMYGFILQMVGNADEADEVFQETWMRVIRHAADFKQGNFRGWVFQMARNLVVDRRRSARRTVSIDSELNGADGVTLGDCLLDGGATPEISAGRRDLAVLVGKAVADLPMEQREVFLMRVHGDLPFKEIARLQEVSINTVLARMHYAVGNLRKRLNRLNWQGELQ